MSRGLICRINVGSISTCPAARAVARRVTTLLLLVLAAVPDAKGVRLAGREVWLHSVPVLSNSEHSFQATENELDFSTSVPEESQHVQPPKREGFPCARMTRPVIFQVLSLLPSSKGSLSFPGMCPNVGLQVLKGSSSHNQEGRKGAGRD